MEPGAEAAFLNGLASLFHEARRGCDVAARLSTYGFAMILPAISANGALEVADGLRDALASLVCQGSHLTASVAVVTATARCWPGTAEQFPDAADRAICQARAEGGNRLLFVEPTSADARAQSGLSRRHSVQIDDLVGIIEHDRQERLGISLPGRWRIDEVVLGGSRVRRNRPRFPGEKDLESRGERPGRAKGVRQTRPGVHPARGLLSEQIGPAPWLPLRRRAGPCALYNSDGPGTSSGP